MKFNGIFLLIYIINLNYYKTMKHIEKDEPILNRLENTQKQSNKMLNNIENSISEKKTNNKIIKTTNKTNNITNRNSSSHKTGNKTNIKKKNRLKSKEEGENIYTGDYTSDERTIKFYIDHSLECTVFVNDTVKYKQFSQINFLEHMILHNNAESIEHKGVYSEDIDINYFTFNKKLNTFSLYFENKRELDKYKVEYDYNAIDLIKSYTGTNNGKNNNFNDMNVNYNKFIWKIINQNFIEFKEKVTIEIYFSLGNNFDPNLVDISLRNVTYSKEIGDLITKDTFVFKWTGILEPQEVIVLNVKFPLYFDQCGNIHTSGTMIIIGAIFIILLIGMLYIIISTVFCEDF